MTVIDTHVYCLPPSLREPGVKLPVVEATIHRAIHAHPDGPRVLPWASPDAIQRSMKRAGIDQSWLVSFPWATPELCEQNNEFNIESARASEGRFEAICSVQPLDSSAAKAAERWLQAGALGIKVNPSWQGGALDDPCMDAVAQVVERRGGFLLCHVDQPFRKSSASPAHLLALARRHPGTRIVAAHMGGLLGLYARFAPVAKDLGNVWFDTAVSETMSMVAHHVSEGLEDRILFGSDFPFSHCHSQTIIKNRLLKLKLGTLVERKILSKNAVALRAAP